MKRATYVSLIELKVEMVLYEIGIARKKRQIPLLMNSLLLYSLSIKPQKENNWNTLVDSSSVTRVKL